jgi:hypothetical protein
MRGEECGEVKVKSKVKLVKVELWWSYQAAAIEVLEWHGLAA